jgi:chromate transporter
MVFGSRLRGVAGGLAAFAGLLLPPTLIMTVLAILYAQFGELETLRRVLAGVSCAAVGLLIAVVFRMMTPLLRRRDGIAVLLMTAVFIAIGILRLPLQMVLLIAIPVSIAIMYGVRSKAAHE